MSFLAIIPIWLGCLACYLGSEKQLLLSKPMNKFSANFLLVIGYFIGVTIFSLSFALASSLLAAFVTLMLALVSHTILSTYTTSIWRFNAPVVASLLVLAGVSYVA